MKAVLVRAPVADVIIEHEGEQVKFDFKYFENKKGGKFGAEGDINVVDPFSEINSYWSILAEDKKSIIFSVYKRVRDVLDTEFDLNIIQEKMTYLTTELMQFHEFEMVSGYVKFNIFFRIPDGIEDVFDPNSNNKVGTRERTYIKEDFRDLITMSIALRPMGVFWGEYIKKVEKEVSNVWKELSAFYLLRNTEIINSKPMARLETYINANIDASLEDSGDDGMLTTGRASAILAGVSTEDFPIWLLSITVVRRVTFADISGEEGKPNIIEAIYHFLDNKLRNVGSTFKGNVKSKNLTADISDEVDKLSIFEKYGSKFPLPLGEVAVIEYVLDRPYQLAKDVEPSLDDKILQDALTNAQELFNYKLEQCQITIAQWILNTFVPARVVDYLNKAHVIQMLAITQAVLINRGFPSIAKLVTAISAEKETDMFMLGEEEVRVPTDLIEELGRYYPYSRDFNKRGKRSNVAITAIDKLKDDFNKRLWKPTMIEGSIFDNIDEDFKLNITRMVIDLNERIAHELPATLDFQHE